MTTYGFLDVEGFAGGFACGATLAGFHLIGKCENAKGFGVPMMEENRAFLGNDWETQACDPAQWSPLRADVVIGNPPCSAFSNFSAGTTIYGIDSKINDCMWDLIRYAARVRPAAVIMESVAQAFSKGQVLMHALSEELRRKSGLAYRTTHVVQDNYSTGGCTLRRRYFLVNSLVPFGVERHDAEWLPVLRDALGDLASLPVTWDRQRYDAAPTWWSHSLRSRTGYVDGHDVLPVPNLARLSALQRGTVRWEPGDRETEMLKKYYDEHGELPAEYRYQSHAGHTRHLTRDKHLIDRGLETGGYGQTRFWPWDQPGRVITGHGPYQVRHPANRCLTHRETARVLGFPDDWVCGTDRLRALKPMHMFWGKGTSVHPAKWVMTWVRESLDGSPGSITGTQLPDGSSFIDISPDWKATARRLGIAERYGLSPVAGKPVTRLPALEERMPPPVSVPVPVTIPRPAREEERVTVNALDTDTPQRKPAKRPAPAPAEPALTLAGLRSRYPGWEYDRKPSAGPVWPADVLDALVTAAHAVTGEGARPGEVAKVINHPEFREAHGAADYRGCAPYHVTQSRERLTMRDAAPA